MKKIKNMVLAGLMLLAAVTGIFAGKINTTEAASSRAWQKINGVCYNGSGKKLEGAITRGIDVSEWQGDINWNKVKGSNVDFAMIRISSGTDYNDKKYAQNMSRAITAGIPVGTYVYSKATTTAQALEEAQHAISKMKGYKISYPVVYDLEYAPIGNLSKTKVSQLAQAFCNEVKRAGYYPMVYCNTYWYSSKIDWSVLSGLDVWLAQYGDKILAPSKTTYKYTIWQSTDGDGGGALNPTKKLISGIPDNCNVDINFGYVDYTKKITPRTQPVSTYVPSKIPVVSGGNAVSTGKNGWVESGGKTYYYKNDKKLTGWQKIGGKRYYFNKKKGYLYKNRLFIPASKKICYVGEDGARVAGKWVTWKNKRYYIGAKGYALKGVKKVGGNTYYFHKTNAYMLKNKMVATKSAIYYFDGDGTRCKSEFKTVGSKTYFFQSNGKAVKGWRKVSGRWYYFNKHTAVMYKNCNLKGRGSGKVYRFNSRGVCTNRK